MDKLINGIILSQHDDQIKRRLFEAVFDRTPFQTDQSIIEVLDIVYKYIEMKQNFKWCICIIRQLVDQRKRIMNSSSSSPIDTLVQISNYFNQQRSETVHKKMLFAETSSNHVGVSDYIDFLFMLVIDCRLVVVQPNNNNNRYTDPLNPFQGFDAQMVSGTAKAIITIHRNSISNILLFKLAKMAVTINRYVPILVNLERERIQTPLIKVYLEWLSNLSLSIEPATYDEYMTSYLGILSILWDNYSLPKMEYTLSFMLNRLNSQEHALLIVQQQQREIEKQKEQEPKTETEKEKEKEIEIEKENQEQEQKEEQKDIELEIINSISPSLSNILNLSPIEYIPIFVPFIVNNDNVSDIELFQTIQTLLKFPLTPINATWILETLNGLIKAKKVKLLALITIECCSIVLKQMFLVDLMVGAFSIVEKMLLGYQSSPEAYHQVIWMFPSMIEFLNVLEKQQQHYNDQKKLQLIDQDQDIDNNNDSNDVQAIPHSLQTLVHNITKTKDRKQLLLMALKESNQYFNQNNINNNNNNNNERKKKNMITTISKISSIRKNFVQLSMILMDHHMGFPELYTPLAEMLVRSASDIPRPSIFEAKKRLQENAWSVLENVFYEKTVIGRTGLPDRGGLNNLGNTCYMNSFIQSLYMTVPIRKYFINSTVGQHQQQQQDSNNNNNNTTVGGSLVLDKFQEWNEASIKQIMNRPPIIRQLQLLFGYLFMSIKQAVSPTQFLRTLPPMYMSGEQQDSFEFGRFLLEQIDELLKQLDPLNKKEKKEEEEKEKEKEKKDKEEKKTVPTIITDTFSGHLVQSVTCNHCKTISKKKEDFLELSLSFSHYGENTSGYDNNNKSTSVSSLIDYFFSKELLHGNEKYHCSKCDSLQDAEKTVQMQYPPPKHLILAIKRFYYNQQTKSISKLLNNVEYSEKLIIPKHYFNQEIEEEEEEKETEEKEEMKEEEEMKKKKKKKIIIKDVEYQLYAVIFHSGSSVNSGHYFTYAKPSNSKEQDWCLFNDSNVQLSDFNSFYNIPLRFHSDTPYILFYKRVDDDDDDGQLNSNNQTIKQTISLTPEVDQISPWIKSDVLRDNSTMQRNDNLKPTDSIKYKNEI
ncbi:peptidase C19 family protein [Cavenderia fasciculata]|uniref:Peptidase C19 family protein n=1 Tax=Cavenderia fasciculata TaxID=261658 RepID=F4QB14_CACFS|nr:peptidase C19 family protein [Cavenderia fasciculata]EGG14786.1 peptidase C19 family protein [Cavenderia fasciculata]|eukprot:XP_004351302.1 peptidase C19 family protein [Cavenderia fasciculata]